MIIKQWKVLFYSCHVLGGSQSNETTWIQLHNDMFLFLIIVSKCLPAQPVPEEGSERELQLVEPHAEIEDIGIYPIGY